MFSSTTGCSSVSCHQWLRDYRYWVVEGRSPTANYPYETLSIFHPLWQYMEKSLKRKDKEVLTTLVDYGILTVSQLSKLCFPSRQMARRMIRELSKRNLVEVRSQDFGSARGRPESLVCLSDYGISTLKSSGCLADKISPDYQVWPGSHGVGHQLLVNWIRIYLDNMVKQLQDIHMSFLSPKLHSDIYHFAINASQPGSSIIPDGIFSISHRTLEMSLLFFLEVDMGTETLSSANRMGKDIRGKILSYQDIFRYNWYKQLECRIGRSFRGFRTLFVADTASRQYQLNRLVRQIDSTNFIWLTDREAIFNRGISGTIWTMGGDTEAGLHSILGPSLAVDCLPDILS